MHPLIKNIFVPHKGNNYHPHFWRAPSVTIFSVILVALLGFAYVGQQLLPRINQTAAIISGVLVDLANTDRTENNLSTLRVNPILQKAAQMKANDMAAKGYFAHISPDGKKPWYWFSEAGYNFVYAGENLAIDYSESSDVNRAWMNSPLHRANILNEHFTEIGIAMAQGVYNGRSTIFVVQLFGQPVPADISVSPVKKTTIPKIAESEKPVTIETIAETPTYSVAKNVAAADIKPVNPTVAGEEKYSSSLAKLLLSPRKTLFIIYIVLALLILLALFLLVGIEIGKHHPKHVIIGLLMLVLIAVLFYFAQDVLIHEVLVV